MKTFKLLILFTLIQKAIFCQIAEVEYFKFVPVTETKSELVFSIRNTSKTVIKDIFIDVYGDRDLFRFAKKLKIVKIKKGKKEKVTLPVKLKTANYPFSGVTTFKIKVYLGAVFLCDKKAHAYIKSTTKDEHITISYKKHFLDKYVGSVIPDTKIQNRISKAIDLSNQKLKKLPQNLFAQNKVVYLDLSGNNLRKIPDYIKNFKDLKVLLLNDNLITKIPTEISELKNLEVLSLYKNPIYYSTTKLTNLKNIKYLYLNDLLYFSDKQISDMIFEASNFKRIVFYNKNSQKEEVVMPIDKSKKDVLKSLYKKTDYKSKLKLGSFFISRGDSGVANILFEQAAKSDFNDYNEMLRAARFVKSKGNEQAALPFYEATLHHSSVKNYKDRLKITEEITGKRGKKIIEQHYVNIINDPSITDSKDMYEIAKMFEKKGFLDFAVAMFQRISLSPENKGTSKELHAKIAILDIYDNNNFYQKRLPRFLIAEEVSNFEPYDDISKNLVIEGCKKTANYIDVEIEALRPEFERYKKRVAKAAKKRRRAKRWSAIGGAVSSLSSFVPGSDYVRTAVNLGGQVTQMTANNVASIRQANINYNRYLSKTVDKKMIDLKYRKVALADKIKRLLNTSYETKNYNTPNTENSTSNAENNTNDYSENNTNNNSDDKSNSAEKTETQTKIEALQAEIDRLKKIEHLQKQIDSLKSVNNESTVADEKKEVKNVSVVKKESNKKSSENKQKIKNKKILPYEKGVLYMKVSNPPSEYKVYFKDYGNINSSTYNFDENIWKTIEKNNYIYNINIVKKTITITNGRQQANKNDIKSYSGGFIKTSEMPEDMKIAYDFKELPEKKIGGKIWKGYEFTDKLSNKGYYIGKYKLYFLNQFCVKYYVKYKSNKKGLKDFETKLNLTKIDLDEEIKDEYFEIPQGYQTIDKRK